MMKTDDNEATTYDAPIKLEMAISAKLKGKFYPREADGNYRFIADEDMKDVDTTIISSWFTGVPEEPISTT